MPRLIKIDKAKELRVTHKECGAVIGLSHGNREDWLSIKEVASLYGEEVHYKWLSHYGDEWLDKCGIVDANFIREMEQRSIKDVYILR